MARVDLDEIRAGWVGKPFDSKTFVVDTERLLLWAESCGETDPRFVDPSHPDFQAHPTFTSCFGTNKILPDDFPDFGGRGIDGGKSVEIHSPLRPDEPIIGESQIHEVYDKTGRSGTMVFIVHRMEFTRESDGSPVATVDWRMIRAVPNEEA